MKKQIIMAVCLLVTSLLFASCGNSKLSNSEAKKQIEQSFTKKTPSLEIRSCSYVENQPTPDDLKQLDQLDQLKKAGFVDYKLVTWVNPYNTYMRGTRATVATLYLKDKINQYLIEKISWFTEDNFVHNDIDNLMGISVKAGTYNYSAEITSIAEAAPDAEGKIVCNVTYNKRISLEVNELAKICKWKPNESDTLTQKGEAKFVKMQDGWKLETR